MTSFGANVKTWLAAGIMTVALPVLAAAQVPGASNQPANNTLSEQDAGQMYRQLVEKNLRATNGDPAQDAAYQAFHNTTTKDADKKIQLGQDFVHKYPASPYAESVYAELAETYYAKQDVENFYTSADKALALSPNDPTMLAMTGWVIPRAYRRDDPFGEGRLDKAEQNAKHAIEIMDTLPKPDGMTDQQFAQFKTEELATAHSGLGLTYFRRGNLEASAKELELATQGGASADPTDFYVLGAAYQNLNRFKDAEDAFNRCAAIPGPLQQDCKANAAGSAQMASQRK